MFKMLKRTGHNIVTKRWIQYVAVMTASMSTLIAGMNFGWPSPSLPKYYSKNESIVLTADQGSWIASINLASDLFGAPLAAFSGDIIGRKMSIALTAIPFFTAWLMVAFANSAVVLYIAKVFFGVGAGFAYSILPVYIGEIADNDIRGLLGSSISFTTDFGVLIIYILGSAASIFNTALISAILPVIFACTFFWMPESPYYYLMKNKVNCAEKSLKQLRGKDDVTEELNEMKLVVNEEMLKPTGMLELFASKSNLRAMLIGMGLKSSQQLSGISAFLCYAQLIFQQIDGNQIAASNAAILFGVVQMTSITLSSLFVDRVGRKPLLITSAIGTGVSLAVITVYFYYLEFTTVDVKGIFWVPILFILIFVLMYSIGLGPLVFSMPGELFPTNVKAKANSLLDLYVALNAFTVIKLFQVIADSFGTFVPFTIFTICCFISAVFTYFCVPETKGKPFEEIQCWLKNIKYEKTINNTEMQIKN